MTTKDEKALSDEEKKKLAKRQNMHNIIVIDEVDQFNSSEKTFTKLV